MDLLSEFLAGAKAAGPYGAVIMTLMWWLERADRIEKEKALMTLLPEMLKAINGSKNAMQMLIAVVTGKNGIAEDD